MAHSTASVTVVTVLATLGLVACGGAAEPVAEPVVATIPARSTVTPPTIARIDDPASVTTPADRVDDTVRITWIGGSEIDLDGRSLPDAVAALEPTVGTRALQLFADTKIAPLPGEVAARVERAADRNVDGLMVILNPSWLSWDGHTECSGIADPHEFYACVLTPRPGTDVDALRSEVVDLVDTVVATGLPAYLYVIPHSAESVTDPSLEPRLRAAETAFAELDPELDRIEYVDRMLSRDLPPLREGIEFNDMVHPGDQGIEILAEFFAAEISRFFATRVDPSS